MEPNKSILRTLLLSFLTFGLIMGIMFPLYAQFFVDWKPGMKFWFVAGCLVAGSTVGIINFWLVKLILISNLKQIAQVASKVAERDLTHRCHINSNDIVGSIVTSINQMNDGLRDLMQQLTNQTQRMTEISNDMHSNTQATHDQATTLHHQSDQVAAAMTELTASAHELSNNARSSAETTQTAEQQAQTGVAAVSTNRENIELLAQEINQAKETVAQVEASSKRIDSILHVVQGISEQTNLLALNAAIEAARAGDQGRGFAVVADEVRTLASRTQHSTHEIQEIIADLRQSVQQTVDIMKTSNERANSCLNRAGNVKTSLTDILASVDSLGNINHHFSNATHEQQQVTEEVSRTLLEIQSTAHNTATYTATTTEVSAQLNRLTNEMNNLISTIKL